MYPAIHGWKTNTKMKKKVKLQGGAIEAEEETTRKLNVKRTTREKEEEEETGTGITDETNKIIINVIEVTETVIMVVETEVVKGELGLKEEEALEVVEEMMIEIMVKEVIEEIETIEVAIMETETDKEAIKEIEMEIEAAIVETETDKEKEVSEATEMMRGEIEEEEEENSEIEEIEEVEIIKVGEEVERKTVTGEEIMKGIKMKEDKSKTRK